MQLLKQIAVQSEVKKRVTNRVDTALVVTIPLIAADGSDTLTHTKRCRCVHRDIVDTQLRFQKSFDSFSFVY